MNLTQTVKAVERVLSDNSPAILTGIGAAGVVTTAVLAAKGHAEALEKIKTEQHFREENQKFRQHVAHNTPDVEPMTKKEVFLLVWPEYLPAVGTGALSIFAIVASHQIARRRATALAAAYSLSEKAWEEYKEKVTDILGEKKEKQARDELQQERLDRDPPSTNEIIVVNAGEQLFRDAYSGRYFMSTLEDVKAAENRLNHRVINDNYASLTDFYDFLGIERTTVSDEVGWNVDKLLEMEITTAMSDDKRPCFVIDFKTVPIRGYYRLH